MEEWLNIHEKEALYAITGVSVSALIMEAFFGWYTKKGYF
ncbi:hypothetical protein D822_01804 [Streptococcus ratti FA-1 = DSM 20564]|uniref:Uncharacterized protein n=1 Tax=Streptococcus ratti FA-1 = DSM 20564 TaxID=699248 RepID=A0ABP2QXS9_STRRT|nr:hypothetical protein SRA_04021 [Streptococcus ratti FA-1 = DSM 20564]EMP71233.1 hypothetical protein D822_01804 [Streptococcus ratti FA-1 = DSM 20564]